ncbi:MAG: hypothetical protein WBA93_07330 [Microcoleaceae cyanobacterium]
MPITRILSQKSAVAELVYDINPNHLGVRSQESGGKKEGRALK